MDPLKQKFQEKSSELKTKIKAVLKEHGNTKVDEVILSQVFGGMRGVATEQAGVADITMLYDPSLSLAENMARMLGKNKKTDAVDSVLMYGGGIVQPTDLNNEILRILEGR